MNAKKILIAFEGIDGSGKTTQILLLKAELDRSFNFSTIIKAKQPEQNEVFKRFVKDFDISPDSLSFMFIYQALHRRQYEATVQSLKNGRIVLADRWNGSFLVYHSIFGLLSKRSKKIRIILDSLAFEGLEPQITFFLDISPKLAEERRKRRGETDEKNIDFYETIRRQYLKLASQKNWIVLDGSKSIDEIHNFILNKVMKILRQE